MTESNHPRLEVRDVSKSYGNINAISEISMAVNAGEVHCLLGDNGAGKSTLIKILSGVHKPDSGEILVDGITVSMRSPADALSVGIATAYQDLAMIPLMSIARNFFLGAEPTKGVGPFRRLDLARMNDISRLELNRMGVAVRDTSQPVGTLSGGERQSVAIARAVYFGARTLILDEPTAALGVKESGVVLQYIHLARERGLAVVFITHNAHHAWAIGDRFTLLMHGKLAGSFTKSETSKEAIMQLMAGGAELDALAHELEHLSPATAE